MLLDRPVGTPSALQLCRSHNVSPSRVKQYSSRGLCDIISLQRQKWFGQLFRNVNNWVIFPFSPSQNFFWSPQEAASDHPILIPRACHSPKHDLIHSRPPSQHHPSTAWPAFFLHGTLSCDLFMKNQIIHEKKTSEIAVEALLSCFIGIQNLGSRLSSVKNKPHMMLAKSCSCRRWQHDPILFAFPSCRWSPSVVLSAYRMKYIWHPGSFTIWSLFTSWDLILAS